MNGISEQGGKVATGVIDALRSQPLILALVLFNCLVFVIIYMATRDQRAQQAEIIKVMIQNSVRLQELLANCTTRHSEMIEPEADHCKAKCYAESPLPSSRPPACSEV
jgi:hypothetical protein